MKQPNHSYNNYAVELNLSEAELEMRKTFLELSEEDTNLLKKVHEILIPFQTEFIDKFYEHIFSFEELRDVIVHTNADIDMLKATQLAYFQSLTSGIYNIDYVNNRLNVGLAHAKIGLDIKWYIGSYRKYLSELFIFLQKAQDIDSNNLSQLYGALTKIVSLDIGLAIDAYIHSSKQTILDLEKRQNKLIQGIDGFIWEFDVIEHKYRYVSSNSESLLGYSQSQWLANPEFQQQIVFPEYRKETYLAFSKAINEGHNFSIEYKAKKSDGSYTWLREHVSAEKNREGNVTLLRGLIIDNNERKYYEDQLAYIATYDDLTGLPNRSLFTSHLKITLAEAKRDGNKLAIFFLDLDAFKNVNDSLGHNAGDQLLKVIADRLSKQTLRESDFVARFGGDEFCILLKLKNDITEPEYVAQRCLDELGKPTLIGTSTIHPRASIGIAIFPNDADNYESLLQCADHAMYVAKKSGKHHYAFCSSEMMSKAEFQFNLENDLRTAVKNGDFILHYQPQVSLHSGKMTSVEALIRWQDPVRGLISPDTFIPVAEKIGLISDIGVWVLKTACQQFVRWKKAGVPINHIAVNISGSHFCTGKLPTTITNVMQETGIQANQLEIEITESVVQTGLECVQCFKELRSMGIKIAIDDFGTGYSCLNSLTQLPIDRLKIDKTFVQDVLSNKNNAAIIATILSMSRILNFSVITEGVEDLNQLNYLHGIGCDIIQGYYFSRPVNAEKIIELANTNFLPVTE